MTEPFNLTEEERAIAEEIGIEMREIVNWMRDNSESPEAEYYDFCIVYLRLKLAKMQAEINLLKIPIPDIP